MIQPNVLVAVVNTAIKFLDNSLIICVIHRFINIRGVSSIIVQSYQIICLYYLYGLAVSSFIYNYLLISI